MGERRVACRMGGPAPLASQESLALPTASKLSAASEAQGLTGMSSPDSVDIAFSNITCTVKIGFRKGRKTILHGVSGVFRSGQLTAVMGPSGAGKSSLLDALTGFQKNGVTGRVSTGKHTFELNGQNSVNLMGSRKKFTYILQDDRLNPLFTVRELMKFAADMQLGNVISEELKLTLIKEVLVKLGLNGTENTKSANLSGGQKKRLSIAMELLDDPPVIYLDEPTTGLDSVTTMQCMMMLKNLARDGRTIVCTIHQPTASIYYMFDQVYVLADGMCIYNGPSENTVPYLASMGLQCPKYHNPADYIIEIASGDYGGFNELLVQKCSEIALSGFNFSSLPSPVKTKKSRFLYDKNGVFVKCFAELHKFRVLYKRCLIQQYRDWSIIPKSLLGTAGFLQIFSYINTDCDDPELTNRLEPLSLCRDTATHLIVFLNVMIGVLLGLLYDRTGEDGAKVVINLGYLGVSVVCPCYMSLMPGVLKYPLELPVLKKEHFNNWYKLRTYYVASLITSMPLQIFHCIAYSVPSYFLSGQPIELPRFLMFWIPLGYISLLSEALGNIIGTCVNPVNGTFLGATVTCAMVLFMGFLVMFKDMAPYMVAVSNFSFLKHGYEAVVLAIYSYGRMPLDCPNEEFYCHMRYPDEIIKVVSMVPGNYMKDIIILSVELVVLRFLAYFTLKWRMARYR